MSVLPSIEDVGFDAAPSESREEWYLLREDVDVAGVVYRAGTLVHKSNKGWRLQGAEDPVYACLDKCVCRTEYGGLSLHVLSCDAQGCISHRRLGSDDFAEVIPASRVLSPPQRGHDKVYLAFGDQFYPLEYFGW